MKVNYTEKEKEIIERIFKEIAEDHQPTRVELVKRLREIGIISAEKKIDAIYGGYNKMLLLHGMKPPRLAIITDEIKRAMIQQAKDYYKENAKLPQQRDFTAKKGRYTKRAIYNAFGSWKKFLIATGLLEIDAVHTSGLNMERKYGSYAKVTRAKDSHVCDSNGEAAVDNWLYDHDIPHALHWEYPGQSEESHNLRNADFYIKPMNIVIEYTNFGKVKDNILYANYVKGLKWKRQYCKDHGLTLIEINKLEDIEDILEAVFLKDK